MKILISIGLFSSIPKLLLLIILVYLAIKNKIHTYIFNLLFKTSAKWFSISILIILLGYVTYSVFIKKYFSSSYQYSQLIKKANEKERETDYFAALKIYTQILDEKDLKLTDDQIIWVHEEKGDLYIKLDRLDDAISEYNQALWKCESNQSNGCFGYKLKIAKIYFEKGEYKTARNLSYDLLKEMYNSPMGRNNSYFMEDSLLIRKSEEKMRYRW